ncbi:S-adenosyl-L-methionine-dependent methyltransferase [Acaromyces ingoldii]|uniref:S-adenosyl-L-methionine-dependent methyltransferase n=1 Tax=Acaromyces ingoldii TaxID=215250 RepID=A0A316YEL0_9BASI|nr:S-adenosyl-L-methionine-dependent methyltransferase [Acaromyces ingoldii]PWN88010.1 S-adenosyl-L-methionine-dependent methyltransferase [Acaromyces ingoldii]
MLSEVVQDPGMRCLQMCGSFFEARALHIAVRAGVPQRIAASPKGALTSVELGKATGIEHRKLARILRCLATNHMLAEVGRDTFANNRISAHLVDNAGLCAYIHHYGEEPYHAAGALMTKLDTPAGASYDILDAPFSDVYGRKPRWEWLEEPDEKTGKPREQLARFGLAMLGAGDVEVPGVLADYDWAGLGQGATVVDVGGGVGQMCIALGRAFSNLRFVVQDRPPVIEQGRKIWAERAADLVDRCELQPHDFFQTQPVQGAHVYLLRHVVHDWADRESIAILRALKPALAPHSRILLAEQIMVCASGDDRIARPAAPLPANYGDAARFSHQRDINMMGLINGIERSPAEFDALVEQAGLVVKAFHPCRSQIGLVEVGLP